MAYEKQTWQTGDVVTSAKLNHMEDGIAGGGGVTVIPLEFENNEFRTSVTWQTIKDLVHGGDQVMLFYEFDFPDDGYYQAMNHHVMGVVEESGNYIIYTVSGTDGTAESAIFTASSADSKAVKNETH